MQHKPAYYYGLLKNISIGSHSSVSQDPYYKYRKLSYWCIDLFVSQLKKNFLDPSY